MTSEELRRDVAVFVEELEARTGVRLNPEQVLADVQGRIGTGLRGGARECCALCEKPEPRYYCWAGQPEDRGEGQCPLGYPARWEIDQ